MCLWVSNWINEWEPVGAGAVTLVTGLACHVEHSAFLDWKAGVLLWKSMISVNQTKL